MPKIRHHRSSRRVPPPKDSDFDHEIKLVNRDEEESFPRPSSAGPSSSQRDTPVFSAADPQAADEGAVAGGEERSEEEAGQPSVAVEAPTPLVETRRPRSRTQASKDHHGRPSSPESAVEILYENERGGFLCGIPLFSSKALGNLDPPAWTNYAHRPSPTNISTAQVPDPSWEWAWPEWRVNRDEGVDEDGWEYSFAFAKAFTWHKARWWNSFVRRRVWIRKRVKKNGGYIGQDPHMLNPEYFTIRPSSEMARDRSLSRASSPRGSRLSMSTVNMEGVEQPAIEHADDLLRVLRVSRIDREKIEAVDNYLTNAQDELEGLQEIMHEIMSLFVFQASRRVLLSKLADIHDKTAADQKQEGGDANSELDRKVKNLGAAVKHADEEVRRLEYWSDVKGMAEEGDSKGAVDQEQGWDPPTWRGLDNSGPSAPAPPLAPKRETKEGDAGTGEART
ncbi:hypothetical protein C8A00DRAFT_17165 [Chaetomidium leptoderma]|uniref:Peroxin/Ferlin domain-containing protein n=1 Tax=Chaetomidium leptoderma TaxID=669021 RepID=A0AAN6VHL1_9PEZI|nr:hypothetical protein C8A00DRAFT_17165 [Chaetomidium leptoderma]